MTRVLWKPGWHFREWRFAIVWLNYKQADERDIIGKQLETILPRALHLQSLEKIEPSVFESGCRDQAPTPEVLKNIAFKTRKKFRRHDNELLSLQKMVEEKTDEDNDVLQKVLLHLKGVMLWSKATNPAFPSEMQRWCCVYRCHRKHYTESTRRISTHICVRVDGETSY